MRIITMYSKSGKSSNYTLDDFPCFFPVDSGSSEVAVLSSKKVIFRYSIVS